MSLIKGEKHGGGIQTIAVDDNGRLTAKFDDTLPVIATPGWRTIWYPWEIKAYKAMSNGLQVTPGLDGRDNFWRYVCNDALPVDTGMLSAKGCDQIRVMISASNATNGNVKFDLFGSAWSTYSGDGLYGISATGTVAATTKGQWVLCTSGAPPTTAAPGAPCAWPFFRVVFTTLPAGTNILTMFVEGR
jgi:hypothetical protein